MEWNLSLWKLIVPLHAKQNNEESEIPLSIPLAYCPSCFWTMGRHSDARGASSRHGPDPVPSCFLGFLFYSLCLVSESLVISLFPYLFPSLCQTFDYSLLPWLLLSPLGAELLIHSSPCFFRVLYSSLFIPCLDSHPPTSCCWFLRSHIYQSLRAPIQIWSSLATNSQTQWQWRPGQRTCRKRPTEATTFTCSLCFCSPASSWYEIGQITGMSTDERSAASVLIYSSNWCS